MPVWRSVAPSRTLQDKDFFRLGKWSWYEAKFTFLWGRSCVIPTQPLQRNANLVISSATINHLFEPLVKCVDAGWLLSFDRSLSWHTIRGDGKKLDVINRATTAVPKCLHSFVNCAVVHSSTNNSRAFVWQWGCSRLSVNTNLYCFRKCKSEDGSTAELGCRFRGGGVGGEKRTIQYTVNQSFVH